MIADLIQLIADSPIKGRARENYDRVVRHILGAFQGPILDQPWEATRQHYLTDQLIDDLRIWTVSSPIGTAATR